MKFKVGFSSSTHCTVQDVLNLQWPGQMYFSVEPADPYIPLWLMCCLNKKLTFNNNKNNKILPGCNWYKLGYTHLIQAGLCYSFLRVLDQKMLYQFFHFHLIPHSSGINNTRCFKQRLIRCIRSRHEHLLKLYSR